MSKAMLEGLGRHYVRGGISRVYAILERIYQRQGSLSAWNASGAWFRYLEANMADLLQRRAEYMESSHER